METNAVAKRVIVTFVAETLRIIESSSDSSDEELPRKIAKIVNFVEQIVQLYNDKQFQSHFRMGKPTLYLLVRRSEESEFSSKQRRCGEPMVMAEKSIMLTIWHLANTETFREISDRFGISISSSHRELVRVLEFLVAVKQEYIVWPNNSTKKKISDYFKKKQNISTVIGCVDGTHVKINRPLKHEESYVNRKQYHSLIIQAVCDHSRLFTNISRGEPGSLHDARVLCRSGLYRRAQDRNYYGHFFLIGHSAYPTLSWLVPPFRDNGKLSENEKEFNFKLSSTRMVIEPAFGLLKGRFRRLSHIVILTISL